MALIKSKGTVLTLGIAGAGAAVGQMISIDLPEAEVETFEADTLDNTNAGIPYKASGRIEGGSVGGELFMAVAGDLAPIVSFLTSGAANLSPDAAVNTASFAMTAGSAALTYPCNTAGLSLCGEALGRRGAGMAVGVAEHRRQIGSRSNRVVARG